ncbi:MAG: hypothetical protein NTW87_16995 [Planctomycetota bacterium]|nr:hypothetical protein [Planctomycetota bacterium]
MDMRPSLIPLLVLTVGLAFPVPARAAERLIRTADGQTFQGEDLGTENGVLKLRTKYGVQEIPARDIVSSKAVVADDEDAPAAEKEAPAAGKEARTRTKPRLVPPPPPTTPKAEAKEEEPEPAPAPPAPAQPAAPPRTFAEPKPPDLNTLLRAQAARDRYPEPDKNAFLEISRGIRNFPETTPAGRRKIVATLRSYGRVSYPFVAAAFPDAADIDIRVDLLEALAAPGRSDTANIFMEAQKTALSVLTRAATAPPPPPPDYQTKRDRDRPVRQAELLRAAAQDVLDIEKYASIAGGPFNALLLLDIYKKRYSDDKTDPLLTDIKRDSARLAATAADAGRSKSSWGPGDRVVLAELVFPMLFKDNSDLQTLAQECLKKLLPTGHPKWDADQTDWVEWWEKAKTKLR